MTAFEYFCHRGPRCAFSSCSLILSVGAVGSAHSHSRELLLVPAPDPARRDDISKCNFWFSFLYSAYGHRAAAALRPQSNRFSERGRQTRHRRHGRQELILNLNLVLSKVLLLILNLVLIYAHAAENRLSIKKLHQIKPLADITADFVVNKNTLTAAIAL
eukprot:SAG11_NODE_1590_length_4624_cov_3.572376_6_plen_160_part_00